MGPCTPASFPYFCRPLLIVKARRRRVPYFDPWTRYYPRVSFDLCCPSEIELQKARQVLNAQDLPMLEKPVGERNENKYIDYKYLCTSNAFIKYTNSIFSKLYAKEYWSEESKDDNNQTIGTRGFATGKSKVSAVEWSYGSSKAELLKFIKSSFWRIKIPEEDAIPGNYLILESNLCYFVKPDIFYEIFEGCE